MVRSVPKRGTNNDYLGMVRYGPEALRKKHRLIVGPWEHEVGVRKVGDLDFGSRLVVRTCRRNCSSLRTFCHRWNCAGLTTGSKGIDNGMMDEPPVHIF